MNYHKRPNKQLSKAKRTCMHPALLASFASILSRIEHATCLPYGTPKPEPRMGKPSGKQCLCLFFSITTI